MIPQEIENLWDQASDMSLEYIRKEARNILKNDSDLHEFIMGMGCCIFTAWQEGKYDLTKYSDDEFYTLQDKGFIFSDNNLNMSEDFQKDFISMVNNLNERFKVMGFPMRFTAEGKEVNDW